MDVSILFGTRKYSNIEIIDLRQTGIAIERNYEKRCSEPRGLILCDGVARQKICAQEKIWEAMDGDEEDEDEDDE